MLTTYHSSADIIGKFSRASLRKMGGAFFCVITLKIKTVDHLRNNLDDVTRAHCYVKIITPRSYLNQIKNLSKEATIAAFNCMATQRAHYSDNDLKFYETLFTSKNLVIYKPKEVVHFLRF